MLFSYVVRSCCWFVLLKDVCLWFASVRRGQVGDWLTRLALPWKRAGCGPCTSWWLAASAALAVLVVSCHPLSCTLVF